MTGFDDIHPSEVLFIDSEETLRVHGITDIHYGSTAFHEEKFAHAIDVIKDDPQARWFGNGDMIELIPSHYKISQRGQNMKPEDQAIEIAEKLQSISEKCLFIRGGNHELRTMNMMDLNITKLIAERLGVPLYHLPGYTVFNIGEKVWKLASGHGFRVAKNGNLELERLRLTYPEADVYYLGHDHKLYADQMPGLGVDEGGECLRNQWFVRGGSFLRYADYARYGIYPIQKIGWVEIEFPSVGDIACKIH